MAESSPGASTSGQAGGSKTDDPLADFGANEWLVDEMYERYQRDPASVDTAWGTFFKENAAGSNGSTGSNGGAKPAAEPAAKQAKQAAKPATKP